MKTLFPTLAATVLLAACSNNGGTFQGHHTQTKPMPNVNSQLTDNGGGQPDTTPPQTAPDRLSGHYLIDTDTFKGLQNKVVVGKIDEAGGKMDVLRVNGQNIDLLPAGLSDLLPDPDFVQWRTPSLDTVIGNHLKHARYGIVIDDPGTPDSDTVEYLFAQGKPSATLPAGVAAYQGRAFVAVNRENVDDEDVFVGKSDFQVDFGKKTLNGTLSFAGKHPDIKLKADIEGNRFQGREGKIFTQGGFYGDNGAELAGIFDERDDKNTPYYDNVGGGFGASKQ